MASPFVIDPGHGGTQARLKSSADGRRLPDGSVEKQVVYSLAQRVAQYLGGAEITRPADDNRSLRERIDVARGGDARVFVSLHAHGREASEAWVHERAGQPSLALAGALGRELASAYGVRLAAVRRADLAVLSPEHHAPATAACLVDLGYRDAAGRGLGEPGRLEEVAAAIARAIRSFAAQAPAPAVRRRATFGSPHGLMEKYASSSSWALEDAPPAPAVPPDLLARLPFPAVCRLNVNLADECIEGTGFYVAPDRILTAGRCVRWNGRPAIRIQVIPGLNGNAQPFGACEVADPASMVLHPRFDEATLDFDLAVLKVPQRAPGNAWFELAARVEAPAVTICGYASDAAGPDRQVLHADALRDVGNPELAELATPGEVGSPGSPVLSARPLAAVGVFVAGWDKDAAPARPRSACCRLTDEKVAWIRGV